MTISYIPKVQGGQCSGALLLVTADLFQCSATDYTVASSWFYTFQGKFNVLTRDMWSVD